MNFHEYQAKQLFADFGIPVPAGRVASSADEAVEAAQSLGDVSEKVIPKPVLVSRPDSGGTLKVRYFMPHNCHKALAIANRGWQAAVAADAHLANGLNVANGRVVHPAVAEALGYELSVA